MTLAPTAHTFGGMKVREAGMASQDWGLFMIIYGPPGAGKTPIAATIAHSKKYGMPLAYFDAEAGSRSIDHYKQPGFDFYDVKAWSDITNILADLKVRNDRKLYPPTEDNPEGGYKTFVFDNLSVLRVMNMDTIAGKGAEPQIQHYGRNTAAIREFVRDCRDISRSRKINVIIIAWDEDEKDESSGIRMKKFNLTSKLQTEVPGIPDIIGYLEVAANGRDRVLDFAKSSKRDSKFRRSRDDVAQQIPLKIPIIDPDWPILADVVDTLRGGKDWPSAKYEEVRKNRNVRTIDERVEQSGKDEQEQ